MFNYEILFNKMKKENKYSLKFHRSEKYVKRDLVQTAFVDFDNI